ncbi:hypothetical protein METBIDRAFT_14068 [Metschnikowia bicuspidata var. bicuspidata NRRL YB-4993]|uniref:PPM-type phosphatase domain-containing protein n=1 Tax=Metschnikowia bicuspidata var. bicuspidata NRRL YB-4993 TaxID=869754 RepID=A0A1A0GWI8_9ASCO|nr:hypothetical protein METBIDRAFT_14068 [Metschnikowia bicuspidata var. bicuspidata NRRL YB-4993]OBA16124.1 hypothetical protein METBIDRAFT_14068 [Metschnikowia bicuspidata var. bicuspidata NRRL YB-4993]
MNAIIQKYNIIQIDTLGAHWAGLYRGDQLIEETKRQKQIDGTPVQICRNVNENVTETGLYSSLQYKWSAQEGDILVVVSDEVRNLLTPIQIENSFSSKNNIHPYTDLLDVAAIRIILEAKRVANENPLKDLVAMVMGIENT